MLQVYLDPCTVNSRKVLVGLCLIGTRYELNHGSYSGDMFFLCVLRWLSPHVPPWPKAMRSGSKILTSRSRTVNYFSSEHKGPEYLKINPMGTVPSAVDDDCKITESNAILQYAADHSNNDQYYPKGLKHRAHVNRWLLWEASVWFQSCYVYLVEYVVKPLLKAEPDQSAIDAEAPKWHKLASILETNSLRRNG